MATVDLAKPRSTVMLSRCPPMLASLWFGRRQSRGDMPSMRLSRYFLPVLKEAPAESVIQISGLGAKKKPVQEVLHKNHQ